MRGRYFFILGLIVFFGSWTDVGAADSCGPTTSVPKPPMPSHFNRDITFIKEDGATLTQPFYPALRTTHDGRVGVKVKLEDAGKTLRLFILKPELLTSAAKAGKPTTWDPSDASTTLTYDLQNFSSHLPKGSYDSPDFLIRHVTFCQGSDAGPTYNSTLKTDDYHLTFIGSSGVADDGNHKVNSPFGLWRFKATLHVKNPKSPIAQLLPASEGTALEVDLDSIMNFGAGQGFNQFLEPMITDDGHLLVGRLGGAPLAGFQTNTLGASSYNIVYSYNPSSNPCEHPERWTDFKPIAFAYFDKALQDTSNEAKYGFARYPFRDGRNQYFLDPDTKFPAPPEAKIVPDLPATYPWIDRQGRNLFFNVLQKRLVGSNGVYQYRNECLPNESPCHEDTGFAKGTNVIGLWTNGKAVMIDGPLNNADYGMGTDPKNQRYLTDLYKNQGVNKIRLASVREVSTTRINVAVNNINIIDSQENLYNYNPNLTPQTRRDVVWRVGKGHVSQEIAFDDFIDPHVLVDAPMNAAWDGLSGQYLDGFMKINQTCANGLGNNQFWGSNEIRLQNAATSDNAEPGQVQGSVRIEPVALGGVDGRGLFLNASSHAYFNLKNESVTGQRWYASVFHHFSGTTYPAHLLSVSGRFDLSLVSETQAKLTLLASGQNWTFTYPSSFRGTWTHWAVMPDPAQNEIRVYVNGNLWQKKSVTNTVDQPKLASNFRGEPVQIGADSQGAVGWYDELKVIVGFPDNPEIFCNHSRGTMIGYSTESSTPEDWKSQQKRFQNPIVPGVVETGCYTKIDFEGIATPTADAVSLRDHFLLNGKIFRADVPRPNHSNNTFCLSCHIPRSNDADRALVDVRRSFSLQPDVLKATLQGDGTPYWQRQDPHRRPLEPQTTVTGYVPTHWIQNVDGVTRLPASGQVCTTTGNGVCYIDDWFLPLK